MRNARPLVIILFSVVIGLVAVALGSQWIKGQTHAATTKVVVAARDLDPGTRVDDSMVKLAEFPAGSPLKDPLANVADATDRIVLARMTAGEPVLASKLAAPGERGVLSAVLPAGHRAITVKVNEIAGVAGFTLPGSYVDLMVHTSDEANKPVSKIVLERILVLAIAQDVQSGDKPKVVNAVTLEVTPEQAERIDLARAVGALSLVLRNQGDKEPSVTAGARKADLLHSAALETPAVAPAAPGNGATKPAAAPAPVVKRRPTIAKAAPLPMHKFEVIRGSKKSVEEFPAETNPT